MPDEPPREFRNVALIGFMGTGKTSVGRCLAARLHFEFLDTDHLIETRARKPIGRIFAEDGEPAFRALEQQLLDELADRTQLVIATGGGLGARPENLVRLKRHALVVCLWATPEVVWERVRHHRHRPLLEVPDPLARLRALLAEREPVYRQADVLIDTGLRHFREVAECLVHQFHSVRHSGS